MSRIPMTPADITARRQSLEGATRALDGITRETDRQATRRRQEASAALVQTRTSAAERHTLLPALAHDPGLLGVAVEHLSTGAFGGSFAPAGVVVGGLYRYYRRHQVCPSRTALASIICEAIQAEVVLTPAGVAPPPSTLSPETAALLDEVYAHPPAPGDGAHYRALLARLIGEEQVDGIYYDLTLVPGQLPDVVATAERWAEAGRKIQAATVHPPHGLYPSRRIDRHAGARLPTGIPFIDRTLEDGACGGGKLYGLLGPFGACKTTLGVQILTSTAVGLVDRGEPGTVAYAVYEDYAGVAYKALQAVTGIARSSLRRLDAADYDTGVLSTSATLMGYETAHYRRLAERPSDTLTPWERVLRDTRPGEAERWEMSRGLSDRFAVLDLEDPDCPAAGSGGVAELEATLDEQVRRTGQPVRLLVVDYLYEMADRQNAATTGKKGEAAAELKQTSDRILGELRRLALKFGCAVWILQQMNAEANKKADGSSPHHADSAGSTAFARPLWSCYTLGRADPDRGGARQLRATKSRNTPPTTGTALVWDDWTGTLVESDEYTVRDGQIVSTGLVAPPVTVTSPPTRADGGQYD